MNFSDESLVDGAVEQSKLETLPLSEARILSRLVVVNSRISFFGGSIEDEIT